MNQNNSSRRQQGLTTVEFSLVGTALFMVLFGLIEFGRLMFTWNVLDEATRRAARLAAVCPVETGGNAYARAQGAFKGSMLPNFSSENVQVEYLEEDGTAMAEPNTEDTFYVRASIIGYSHQVLIPFFDITLDALTFATTLPAESLGVIPASAANAGQSGHESPLCSD